MCMQYVICIIVNVHYTVYKICSYGVCVPLKVLCVLQYKWGMSMHEVTMVWV